MAGIIDLGPAPDGADQSESNNATGEPETAPGVDLATADPFPVDKLPEVLARQAEAIADVSGVPLAMSAPLVLAAASASIGRGVRVASLNGRLTYPNLFLILAKRSGSGGSGAFALAMAPLFGFQASARRHHAEATKPQAEAERELTIMEIEKIKKAWKESKQPDVDRAKLKEQLASAKARLAEIEKDIVDPLFVMSDSTPEGAANLLSLHGETMAHFDPDAGDAIQSILGKYSDGAANDSLWLKGYSNEGLTVVRKNSGTINLEAVCLSTCFVVTPGRLRDLFANERLSEDGLLPRFLVVDPEARMMPIDLEKIGEARKIPASVAQSYEAALFQCLDKYRIGANAAPFEIQMEPEARLVLAKCFSDIAIRTQGLATPYEARLTEQAARLALLFHIFRHVIIEQRGEGTFGVADMLGHERPLRARDVEAAIAVRDWFARRQAVFLAGRKASEEQALWERVRKLMQSRPGGITARDLYNGRTYAESAAEANALLASWMESGRIFSRDSKSEKGRKTVLYFLSVMQSGRI